MDRSALQAKFDLTGRTAVVTGGTRGIGLAIAEGLVGVGANVVVASRKAEACAAAAEQLQQRGCAAIGVPTHLGDVAGINALVEATLAEFGAMDIVINNAANPLAQNLGEITAEAREKSFSVNLQGPVFLVQAALPYLRKSPHAAILNVVSAGAFIFSPMVSMYSAAKAAMVSFTRSMAAEFASDGFRVNALAPGSVDTDMVRKKLWGSSRRWRRRRSCNVSLPRRKWCPGQCFWSPTPAVSSPVKPSSPTAEWQPADGDRHRGHS